MFFFEMPPEPPAITQLDHSGNITRETLAPVITVNCAASTADSLAAATAIASQARRGDGLLFLPYNRQGNSAAIREALSHHDRVFVIICGPDNGETRSDFHGYHQDHIQGRERWTGPREGGRYGSQTIHNPRQETGLFGFMRVLVFWN